MCLFKICLGITFHTIISRKRNKFPCLPTSPLGKTDWLVQRLPELKFNKNKSTKQHFKKSTFVDPGKPFNKRFNSLRLLWIDGGCFAHKTGLLKLWYSISIPKKTFLIAFEV